MIVSNDLIRGLKVGRKVPLKILRETIEPPQGHSFRMIRWARNLREVEMLLAGGEVMSIEGEGVHWHHHVEMELTFFTEGSGTRFVGDHIGAFAAGEVVLLGARLPHYWHTKGKSSGVSIAWHFPPGHAVWAFPEMAEVLRVFRRAERGIRYSGEMAERLRRVVREMAEVDGAGRLAKLMELFAIVSAMPDEAGEVLSAKAFGLAVASRYQAAIAAAVQHVIANFREEVRVETLLKLTGMSRPTFSRQFKEHSGRTLSEFVNALRLQAACRELLETDRTVLEIAMDCGYNQISFFNRLFRREKGCSPREFRMKSRTG